MRLSSSSVRVLVQVHLRLIKNGKDPICSMTEREIEIEVNKNQIVNHHNRNRDDLLE